MDSMQEKYSRPSGVEALWGWYLRNHFSWKIESAVAKRAPMQIAAKTPPDCCVLKPWSVPKTSGMEPNWRYKTAHAKAAQREKKKTTGSVNRKSGDVSASCSL
ncbi:hypothetical protein KEM55_005030 [Ascosphaera atra]|nr:hypothetical protein KEM55_005030 [Ascosphaera atra]